MRVRQPGTDTARLPHLGPPSPIPRKQDQAMSRLRTLIKALAATLVAGALLAGPASAGTPPRTDPTPTPAPSGSGAATFGIQPATADRA